MHSSYKLIQPPRAFPEIHTLPPLSLSGNSGHSTTVSHACHAAIDEQGMERTIITDPAPPYISHLDACIADIVRCPLEWRPCCFTLRSFEKCRAASHDIRLDIYDANRMLTVPVSSQLSSSSLSVYKSSTAIFAWPHLLPASQMDRGPVLYADIGCAESISPSDIYPEQSPTSVTARQENSLNMGPSKSLHVHPPHRSDLESDGDQDRRSPSWMGYHGESRGSLPPHSAGETGGDTDGEVETLQSRQIPFSRVRQWEDYAEEIQTANGRTAYLCLWTIKHGDRVISCSYLSKKQLVKRHIETTHLKFKPFVCDICQKAFPQKTSLEIHMSGHTGNTPHQCKYGCGEAFKDPARRHRHHVEVHGYIPKQSKKKHKVDMSDY